MQDLSNFVHMGGYAAYVWSAFGLSLFILIVNLILPIKTEKLILRSVKKRLEGENQKS
jgi:heme exporter protein D